MSGDGDAGELSYHDIAYSAVCRFAEAMIRHPAGDELQGPSESDLTVLNESVMKLESRCGARQLIVYQRTDPPRTVRVDRYVVYVINELYGAGIALAKSVSRAYVYHAALVAHQDPTTLTVERKPEGFAEIVQGELWEAIEVVFLRAAGFWDRMGQLLEFIFFQVRDYRDGFSGTIVKLKANFDVDGLPFRRLRESRDWMWLKEFCDREHGQLAWPCPE